MTMPTRRTVLATLLAAPALKVRAAGDPVLVVGAGVAGPYVALEGWG